MNKRIALLLVTVGILMAVYQTRLVYSTCMESCWDDHQAMMNRTALEPFRYRVLTPLVMDGLTRLIANDF